MRHKLHSRKKGDPTSGDEESAAMSETSKNINIPNPRKRKKYWAKTYKIVPESIPLSMIFNEFQLFLFLNNLVFSLTRAEEVSSQQVPQSLKDARDREKKDVPSSDEEEEQNVTEEQTVVSTHQDTPPVGDEAFNKSPPSSNNVPPQSQIQMTSPPVETSATFHQGSQYTMVTPPASHVRCPTPMYPPPGSHQDPQTHGQYHNGDFTRFPRLLLNRHHITSLQHHAKQGNTGTPDLNYHPAVWYDNLSRTTQGVDAHGILNNSRRNLYHESDGTDSILRHTSFSASLPNLSQGLESPNGDESLFDMDASSTTHSQGKCTTLTIFIYFIKFHF